MIESKQDHVNNATVQIVKQPYEKPKLRVIELLSDEVLATGCKSDVIGGPADINECAPGCFEFGS